jgi:hypothetical protein
MIQNKCFSKELRQVGLCSGNNLFCVKKGLKMQGLSLCCQVLSVSPCYKVENRQVIYFCLLAASGSKWCLRSAVMLCDA